MKKSKKIKDIPKYTHNQLNTILGVALGTVYVNNGKFCVPDFVSIFKGSKNDLSHLVKDGKKTK
jgi:hypothetical protein